MAWLKSNWRWGGLNLLALSILIFILNWGSTDPNDTHTFDPGLESGKWAIRFLLICLAMSPLNAYFNWRQAIKLRKPAGLWAFGFAVVHLLFYISQARLAWLTFPMQLYLVLGLLGLVVLAVLAITSNRWAMRHLRKNWKRLHRLVYLAGLAVTVHAILSTSASKKLFIRDPQAIEELKLYLGLLIVLLVVRIPLVRRVLKQILSLRRPQHQVELPVDPVFVPDHLPEYWPEVYSRNGDNRFDDPGPEVQPEENAESQPEFVN